MAGLPRFGLSVVFCCIVIPAQQAEIAPPQGDLKSYYLHGSPNSADFSEDETLVVTECTTEEDTGPGVRKFSEVVQLWNFKQDRLIREVPIQAAEAHASIRGAFHNPVAGQRFVRFSYDGTLILAYIDNLLHVLQASNLAEIRRIVTPGPSDVSRQTNSNRFGQHTLVEKPILRNLEISPTANMLALLWTRGPLYSRVELYDFSAGRSAGGWDVPQGWSFGRRGLTWHPSGRVLLVARANALRCGSPGNTPDVFAFEVPSGIIRSKLTTGLLVGDIAVTPDSRVFAVDNDCMTVFKDHHPKMKVFDLGSGKHIRDIRGRGTGVRYTVAMSRDGERVIAWTGKLKINFDWADMVANDARVDSTFSIWSARDYRPIATSQDIPGLDPSTLRVSAKGTYALSCGKNAAVYELP